MASFNSLLKIATQLLFIFSSDYIFLVEFYVFLSLYIYIINLLRCFVRCLSLPHLTAITFSIPFHLISFLKDVPPNFARANGATGRSRSCPCE